MEILDLYTKDRVRTGKTIVRGEKLPEGYYRLVVHICIFNSKGQMLIQKRQPFKKCWSDLWDLSAGGCAKAGESSQISAEREVKEELGLDISLDKIRPALTVNLEVGFDDVYIVERDIDINTLELQYEEVQSAKWADEDEIYRMIDEKVFIPYHKKFIEMLFFMRNHKGERTKRDKETGVI